ncbi:MAG: hypothetical protein NT029_04800 [Armatimonadetes bacterium]|nr:hypothetical protein [Armatimonadota bacterium]
MIDTPPHRRLSRALLAAGALYAALAFLYLAPAVAGGRVLLPWGLAARFEPWASERPDVKPEPWDPLVYDGIGQFYPWRAYGFGQMRQGRIALWNPYQMCGQPFLANGQSALLYPGNAAFWFMPTGKAFAATAWLHLALAGLFAFGLLRRLGASVGASVAAGIVFAFSNWQAAWLHLPTFLCTSAWMPAAMWASVSLVRDRSRAAWLGLTLAMAMAMLAGHLQVAVYVAMAAAAAALYAARGMVPRRALGGCVLAVTAMLPAALVASPQISATLDLARRSHRSGGATAAGYASYTAYAVAPAGLMGLVSPGHAGVPTDPQSPYSGVTRGGMLFNYAEGACYVGLLAFLLGGVGIAAGRGRFLGLLGGLAWAVALGTPVAAALYFGVPGFSGSGSPGRILVIWSLAAAGLVAAGIDAAVRGISPKRLAAGLAGSLVVAVLAYASAWRLAGELQTSVNWGQAPAMAALAAVGLGALLAGERLSLGLRHGVVCAVLAADLFVAGVPLYHTAREEAVYPASHTVEAVKAGAGHDRAAALNASWSFAGPRAALPPNAAMVYGYRDVQGYDSLMPAAVKRTLTEATGADPSPPEVGNMVFLRPEAASRAANLGVGLLLTRTDAPSPAAPEAPTAALGALIGASVAGGRRCVVTGASGAVTWLADTPSVVTLGVRPAGPATLTLRDTPYPGWQCTVDGAPAAWKPAGLSRTVALPAGSHRVTFRFAPELFQVTLYLGLLGIGLLCGVAAVGAIGGGSRAPRSGAAGP